MHSHRYVAAIADVDVLFGFATRFISTADIATRIGGGVASSRLTTEVNAIDEIDVLREGEA